MIVDTTEFRKGLRIIQDDEPFTIVEFQHVKPGKGGAFVRTRLKSLITGNVLDKTFRSGDKMEVPDVEEKQMQFLYKEGTQHHFMDEAQNATKPAVLETGYTVQVPLFVEEGDKVKVDTRTGQYIERVQK
jgi:translation elongation factor P/translation initiation factor 5A